ncbi:Acetyltransferase (GNAT) domain-containing protein [Aliiroseovarius sediminilitoris]|uniref:Acetyltransferase (GNAT) domain-containing protein n=1 Tax=Aliiroseovarius sediminilitoris TaxID=1173584 RepID=A0A1I0MP98_9RHOB|nr:GNAT family N-acetyltransferase [Aliiroseovarius sediminilitoris]SEV90064.1 Acetyltransferase (GNAT) domain-containing protein [Aliiroseovarius sediminilitoris]
MSAKVILARTPEEIDQVRVLVWEFFDGLRAKYTEMLDTIDEYLEEQNVKGELENFADHFLPPHGECFLALLDNEPVGIVLMKPKGANDAEMNRMYVRDTARGKGIGRKLGEALLSKAQAQGVGMVWLDALYRHNEALPLYESLGFVRFTDPEAFHGDDERVIHMKLKL